MRSAKADGAEIASELLSDATAGLQQRSQIEKLEKRETIMLDVPPFFQEGIPTDALADKIAEEDPMERERYGLLLATELEDLGRVSGFSRSIQREIRLFAWSAEDLERLQNKVEESLEERYGLAGKKAVKWQSSTICTCATVWAIRLEAETMGERVPYLLLYGVLDAELAYSIGHETATLWKIAALLAIGSGALAFVVSIFFTRPLQKMTEMSKAVVASEPGRLHENLRKISEELPTHRRDEVGDIARSSKVLFAAVIDSHKELDRRVQARTEKLNSAKTELQQANERLQSLNREKDLFVAKISHNLRQPLNAIYLEVETFLALYEPNKEQEETLINIQGHADRQQEMVSEILAYQKIIMGSDKLTRQKINAPKFIRNLASAHQSTAATNGNKIEIEIEDEVGDLEADQLALNKILDNLLTNACKFTKDGTVTIAAAYRHVDGRPWIEFAVNDEGEGMSPDEQAKAFTPFVYRKTGNESGNGLGLVICKELTEQMGGRIGFVSEVGKGTRFTILLPVEASGDRYEDLKRRAAEPSCSLHRGEGRTHRSTATRQEVFDSDYRR